MKIVGYVRVSTEDQADRGSPEVQIAEIKRYAEYHRLDLTDIYSDEGISGTLPFAQRPQGARLLADARSKKFDAVVFYALDRVGRTVRVILEAMDAFTSLALDVHCVKDRLDTSTAGGKIAYHVLMVLAEIERDTLLERTANGRERIAREGRFPGGPVSFGYAVIGGRLVPSTRPIAALGMTEAEAVRDIFQRIADGSSLMAEVKRLNLAGVATAKGGAWFEGRLSRLLREPVYLGQYIYHAKSGDITIPVPPLIDLDLRDRALAQLRQNATNRPTGVLHLLRGKIRCSLCGSTYAAQSKGKQSGLYYRCTRQIAKRGCSAASVKAEPLEALAWETCRDLLRHPGSVFDADIYLDLEARDANRAAEIQRLRNVEAEQLAAKQQVIGLVGRHGVTSDDVAPELERIDAEYTRVHAELTRLETTRGLAAAYLKQIRRAEATIRSLTPLHDTPENRRRAIEVLLQKIEVHSQGEGRAKEARLTFFWLGQEAYSPATLNGTEHAAWLDDETIEEGNHAASRDGHVPGPRRRVWATDPMAGWGSGNRS
jgi:site-specific DNA recombinase